MIKILKLLSVLLAYCTPIFSQQPIDINKQHQLPVVYSPAMNISNKRLNINEQRVTMKKKSATVKDVFSDLTKQNIHFFLVADEVYEIPWKADFDYKNEPISKVSNDLMIKYPIICTANGNIITVTLLPSLFKSVSCKVTDLSNHPVAKATVTIKNHSYITDTEGNAEIPFVQKGDTILAGNENYMIVKQKVVSQKVTIRLYAAAKTLEYVTVSHNNGLQNISEEIATGSFKTADMEVYDNGSANPNIIDRGQFILPLGRNTNSSDGSLPGSVNGTNTFSGNRHSLLVVNNYLYNLPTNFINPNDVDSITVLRDAGAGSIWGAYSANGVQNFSFKKGYPDKTIINFLSSITIGEKPNIFYNQGMNAAARITFDSLGYKQPGAYTIVRDQTNQVNNHTTTLENAEKLFVELRKNDLLKEIKNQLYTNPVAHQYAINIQTGGRKFLFYSSLGLDEQKQAEKGNTWNRKTALLNTSYQEKKFAVEGTIVLTRIDSKNNFIPIPFAPRYLTLTDINGRHASIPYLYSPGFIQTAQQNGFLDWNYRPMDEAALANNTTEQSYYSISGKASYTLPYNIKSSLAYQHSIYIRNDVQLHTLESFFTRDLINQFRQKDSSGKIFWPIPQADIRDANDAMVTVKNLRAQLDYSLNKKDLTLISLAGIEKRSFELNGKEFRYYASNWSSYPIRLNYDSLYTLSTGSKSKIPYLDHPYDSTDNTFSYYGSAFLTYKSYTLSGNIRKDWSNRFSRPINHSGIGLWSVGGAWNIKKKKFLTRYKIDELKLRSSFGINGNVDYSSIPTNSIQSFNNGQAYAVPSTEHIGWEKISIFDIGADLKSKYFSASLDFYLKSGNDLLQYSLRNPTTGAGMVKDNSGSMKGKGVDIEIKTKMIKISPIISYTSGFALAHSTNKATSTSKVKKTAAELINPYTFSPVAGYSADALFAYKSKGLNAAGAPVGYINGDTSVNYAAIISATDGATTQYVGSSVPTTGINWLNSFHVKQWTVSCMTSAKLGFWVRKPALNYSKILTGQGGDAPGFDNRWQKIGDELTKTIPVLKFPIDANAMDFYEGSTANVVNGNNIRIQYVQLSYQYESAKNSNSIFKRFECFLTINNLGIIYRANKDHLDPEIPLRSYPAGRSLTLTLKLSY
jgi:hypothetical protein